MTICIPTIEEKGINSRLSDHFGRAPFHILVDLETLEAKPLPKESVRDEEEDEEDHRRCAPVDLMAANHVELVACKGIGRGAIARLAACNIKVFGASADTVDAVIEDYRQQGEAEMGQPHVCDGREHEHEHGHRHGRGQGRGHGLGRGQGLGRCRGRQHRHHH